MCGRLNITDSAAVIALMEQLGFKTANLKPRFYEPQYNVAPTDQLLVAGVENNERFLRPMTWWLTPSWAPSVSRQYAMFNARAEGIEKSRAFKGPFRYRRCLIPASGFIEWQSLPEGKQPFYVTPPEGVCLFAGIWDVWDKGEVALESCAIITTEASESFRHVHNRMPVILGQDQIDLWLESTVSSEELGSLLGPRDLKGWKVTPLSNRINNSRNKSPTDLELKEPAETL